jgi:hypothetical protein
MSNEAIVTRTFEIVNVKGLHARAAARFVEVVEAHDAEGNRQAGRAECRWRQYHGAFDVGSIHRNHY